MHDNWETYISTHNVPDYILKEVSKALNCYGHENGSFVFYCSKCDKYIFQSYGCNSRVCSCCGKRYTDQWSYSLSNSMFNVSHRHFVMSVPDALWPFLHDWEIRKEYMASAIECFNDYFSKILHRKINVGVIVILHSFGKDMKFQPHLHLLITEGGFDKGNNFLKCEFIPAKGFRKSWQYHILEKLQANGLPNELATQMYNKYTNGFYVWLHSRGRIVNPKQIMKYVGRYVRHPAIANSRIFYYDGKIVKFYYLDENNKRIEITMPADKFISALIQHIPPTQFKLIRYYGAYSRKSKRKYGAKVQSSIKQLNLYDFGLERIKYCPYCHTELQFIWYSKKPPPETNKNNVGLLSYIR